MVNGAQCVTMILASLMQLLPADNLVLLDLQGMETLDL